MRARTAPIPMVSSSDALISRRWPAAVRQLVRRLGGSNAVTLETLNRVVLAEPLQAHDASATVEMCERCGDRYARVYAMWAMAVAE
jgi:hypothetical protein